MTTPVAEQDAPDQPITPDDVKSPVEQLAAEKQEESALARLAVAPSTLDLTVHANQVELTPKQRSALKAVLNFDPVETPDAMANVQAFLHLAGKRQLDPFAREVYLIARGKGDKRKYTMQVGIDGYRILAGRSGRFLGIRDVLWTGADDAEDSYWRDINGVMRRQWYDQWPARRGNPGSAKVVVAFRDEDGSERLITAVADWDMYAPYEDVWEGSQGNRHPKRDRDGNIVRTLNAMWTKGGPHMLAKCAEALALRKAMPALYSGLVAHEEMHRVDALDRDRAQRDREQRIIEAAASRVGKTVPADPTPQHAGEAADEQRLAEGQAPTGPLLPMADDSDDQVEDEVHDAVLEPHDEPADQGRNDDSDDVEDAVVEDDEPDPSRSEADYEQERQHLLAEARWMASLWQDVTPARFFARALDLYAVADVEDLNVEEVRAAVQSMRSRVSARLRQLEHPGAAAYASLNPDEVGDLSFLLGGQDTEADRSGSE